MTGKRKAPRKTQKKSGKIDLPEILSYDEIDAVVAASDDLEELGFLHVGLFGGLRISEIIGLRVKDVRPDLLALFVSAESAKGDKERYVPVTSSTIALLRGLSKGKGPEELIFTRKQRAYQFRLDKLAEKAGIRKINPHMLRHTCATMQVDQGIDLETIRANLGHSDISTTQIYLHLNIRRRSRKYHDAMRGII